MAKEKQKKVRVETSENNPFEWIGMKRSGTDVDWVRPMPVVYQSPAGIVLHPGGSINRFGPTGFSFCLGIKQKAGFVGPARKFSSRKPVEAKEPSGASPAPVTEYSEWVRFAGQFDWSEIQRRLDRYHPEGWEDKPHVCVAIRLCRWEEMPYHHLLLPDRFLNPRGGEKPESIPECMKEYFSDILEDARRHLNSKMMDTAEYLRILEDLTSFTQRVTAGKMVGLDDLQVLNGMKTHLERNPTHIHDFLYEFWASLAQELCQRQIAGQCHHCGLLMMFRSSKRYCALKQENRDCSKAARNQRYRTRQKTPSFPAR